MSDSSKPPLLCKDPVCGMTVDPAKAAAQDLHAGIEYFFCSKGCAAKFHAQPGEYLKPVKARTPAIQRPMREQSAEYVCPMDPEVSKSGPGICPKCGMALEPATVARMAQRIEYTCPMHPEIVRDQPGPCPICGMALERPDLAVQEGNPELAEMTRKLWIASALTLPLLALMISDVMPGRPLQRLISPSMIQWVQLALATPVVAWCGWPFFQRGWASITNRSLNMFTLIAIGIGTSYAFSLASVIAPSLFPAPVGVRSELPLYFEAAAVVTSLVLAGQVLELRARSQTSSALRALMDLAPRSARRVAPDGNEADVALTEVSVGDHLRVRPGEKVPVDGVILEGHSSIDESLVTGEAIPAEKTKDSPVTGGTINGNGSFLMEAKNIGTDTLLARIVQMVSQAQRSRAPVQRLADKVAAYFVPAVLAISAITFIAWGMYGPEPKIAHALVNAVAVLIIACPCALGLATPMAIMVGTGRGASAGILVRNAEALEKLEKVTVLAVDKTGTLTEGRPKLTAVVASLGFDEAAVLRLAASLEQGSEHPLADAIVAGARARGIKPQCVSGFRATTGKGATGLVDGKQTSIGNESLFIETGGVPADLQKRAEALRTEGQTVMYVASEGAFAGLIAASDVLKGTTPDAVRELQEQGLRVLMLTGDNQTTAAAMALDLDIEFHADVLPEQKAAIVKSLQTGGAVVAMAGDGVNDAPAMAQADVGIAMGTGTDVAMETGGITLLRGDLMGIVRARRLSRHTMRNIRQNLFFAFLYNALGVPLAAGVLYPAFGFLLNPMFAAAAMSLSSASVIGNALRLRRLRL